jgi:hypothetical protein
LSRLCTDLIGYANHFQQIASWGFVVVAADSCDVGCTNKNGGAPYTDCAGLPPLKPDLWRECVGGRDPPQPSNIRRSQATSPP